LGCGSPTGADQAKFDIVIIRHESADSAFPGFEANLQKVLAQKLPNVELTVRKESELPSNVKPGLAILVGFASSARFAWPNPQSIFASLKEKYTNVAFCLLRFGENATRLQIDHIADYTNNANVAGEKFAFHVFYEYEISKSSESDLNLLVDQINRLISKTSQVKS